MLKIKHDLSLLQDFEIVEQEGMLGEHDLRAIGGAEGHEEEEAGGEGRDQHRHPEGPWAYHGPRVKGSRGPMRSPGFGGENRGEFTLLPGSEGWHQHEERARGNISRPPARSRGQVGCKERRRI